MAYGPGRRLDMAPAPAQACRCACKKKPFWRIFSVATVRHAVENLALVGRQAGFSWPLRLHLLLWALLFIGQTLHRDIPTFDRSMTPDDECLAKDSHGGAPKLRLASNFIVRSCPSNWKSTKISTDVKKPNRGSATAPVFLFASSLLEADRYF